MAPPKNDWGGADWNANDWNATENDTGGNWGAGGDAGGSASAGHEFGDVHAGAADDNWAQQKDQAAANGGDETPRAAGGVANTCRRCHKPGHIARECTEERDVSDMKCNGCGDIGHAKADCPVAECGRCRETGHKAIDCTNKYVFPIRKTLKPADPEDVWEAIVDSINKGDFTNLIDGFHLYEVSASGITWQMLQEAFIAAGLRCHLCTLEQPDLAKDLTLVDLQGNVDRKYQIIIRPLLECPRPRMAPKWPKNAQDNLERLANAGIPCERGVELCLRCKEIGHISKNCPMEKPDTQPKIICIHCSEEGHRARDCTVPRKEKKPLTCRNCGESGHKKDDCTNEPNMDLVTCRDCSNTGHYSRDCPDKKCKNCDKPGHMAKDCPEPRSHKNTTCRNCDEIGHPAKECPKPKDWSRVTCTNCGEKGHGAKRCTNPGQDDHDDDEGGVHIGHLDLNDPKYQHHPRSDVGDDGNEAVGGSGW